jgi:hypothetical protein
MSFSQCALNVGCLIVIVILSVLVGVCACILLAMGVEGLFLFAPEIPSVIAIMTSVTSGLTLLLVRRLIVPKACGGLRISTEREVLNRHVDEHASDEGESVP